MTDQQAFSVLKRMAQREEAPPAELPLTLSRAVKLATSRGAEHSIGLNVTAGTVREDSCDLDHLVADLSDTHLLMALRDASGVRGVIACDVALVDGASEAQTFGAVMPDPPEDHPITGADVSLVTPLLTAILDELAKTTPGTALDGWADGVTVAERFDRARSVGFALGDQHYRKVSLALAFDGTERSGELLIALPSAPAAPPVLAVSKVPKDWATTFRTNVMAAPVNLNAVLLRWDVPLSTVANLSVGQVVALPGAKIGALRVEDLDGNIALRGRMGQIDGNLAIRIEEPERPDLLDLAADDTFEGAAFGMVAGVNALTDDTDAPALDGLSLPLSEGPEMEEPAAMALPDGVAMADADGLDLPEVEAAAPEFPMASLDGLADADDTPDLALGEAAPMMMASGLDLSDIADEDPSG